MTTVHVIGAAGYAAGEFVRLVAGHPGLQLGHLESASHSGTALADAFPALRDSPARFAAGGAVETACKPEDLVALTGSASAARSLAPRLLARGARVIDFSDAFRLAAHAEGAVYGWTERYAQRLRDAHFVANPGCYPTATLLALAPLAALDDRPLQLIVDAKSGVTGAGRTPRPELLFAEAAGDVRAYGLGGHRHEPEIAQELAALGLDAPLLFTPHVVPLARGLLADCYAVFARAPDASAVAAAYARAYTHEPLVRVLPFERAPSLPAVAFTAAAEVHASVCGTVVRAICAIDNLGKGAAGQALQTVNLILGYPKEAGLDARAPVRAPDASH